MYTFKLLAPLIISTCAEGLTTGYSGVCVLDTPKTNVVKYYQPGKSCYVNGTFYSKCEDRLNGSI